ncbi:hypothetical protein H0H92_003005 [Tricholoma furcatifolium]|nr:hypothetical protein H0H92_003005 [Tricholoma furcatifolium]
MPAGIEKYEVVYVNLNPQPKALEPLEPFLQKEHMRIGRRPQQLIIGVRHGDEWDRDHAVDMIKIAKTLDGVSPFKVDGLLPDEDFPRRIKLLPLNECFSSLGYYLRFLVTRVVDTSLFHELKLVLPTDIALRYDPTACPPIPPRALLHLRHLTWAGHPVQLLSSFVPLSPALLENLETLSIHCNMTLDDCIYILYHAKRIKKFDIHTIKRPSQAQTVFPLNSLGVPSQGIFICPVEDLQLRSEDEYGPLFERFRFPFLRHLKIFGWNAHWMHLSALCGMEALNWEALETLRASCPDHDGEEERFLSYLSSSAHFSHTPSMINFNRWPLDRDSE